MRYNKMVPGIFLSRPNRFIAHGSVDQLLEECGLTSETIAARIREAVRNTEK